MEVGIMVDVVWVFDMDAFKAVRKGLGFVYEMVG